MLATTLLHEMTHKYLGTKDYAYYPDGSVGGHRRGDGGLNFLYRDINDKDIHNEISTLQFLNNADTIANLIMKYK